MRLPATIASLMIAAVLPATSALAQEAPQLVPVFTILAEIGPAQELGYTVAGPRRIIPITGGTFEGPGRRGTIVPGGWAWQLRRQANSRWRRGRGINQSIDPTVQARKRCLELLLGVCLCADMSQKAQQREDN